MRHKILVVDDEPDGAELVQFNLVQAGFEVVTAPNGVEALMKARSVAPALIVLDIMLPGMNGIEVCKILRRDDHTAKIPIIMLTAKASEVDRILGLEMGADDYMTKPFSPRELVVRIRNILQRTSSATVDQPDCLRFGELVIDQSRYLVSWKGESIGLTRTEFKLLCILAQAEGRVLSREQLLHDVWGYTSALDTRTVDTHMRRLRVKLGPVAKFLETVRGVGYRFVAE